MKVGVHGLRKSATPSQSIRPLSSATATLPADVSLKVSQWELPGPNGNPPAGITVVTFCSLWPSFCRRSQLIRPERRSMKSAKDADFVRQAVGRRPKLASLMMDVFPRDGLSCSSFARRAAQRHYSPLQHLKR